MYKVIFFLALACLYQPVFGQDMDETITFDGDDKTIGIDIQVEQDAKSMEVKFDGEISEGTLIVTLVSPSGEKENHFILDCNADDQKKVIVDVEENNGNGAMILTNDGDEASVIVTRDGEEIVVVSGSGKNKVKTTTISSGKNSNSNTNKNKNKDSDDDGYEYVVKTGKSKSKAKGKGMSKVKTYSYSTDSDESGSGAKGVMSEVYVRPESGTWKIEIESKGAKGEASIEVEHK